jgi:hypothetical protein
MGTKVWNISSFGLGAVVVGAGAREHTDGLALEGLRDPLVIAGDNAGIVFLRGRVDECAVQTPDADHREPIVGKDAGLDADREVAMVGAADVPREQVGGELLLDDRPGETLGSYLRILLGAGNGGSRPADGGDADQPEQQRGSAPYEATVAVDDPHPLINHVQPDGCPLTRRAVPSSLSALRPSGLNAMDKASMR